MSHGVSFSGPGPKCRRVHEGRRSRSECSPALPCHLRRGRETHTALDRFSQEGRHGTESSREPGPEPSRSGMNTLTARGPPPPPPLLPLPTLQLCRLLLRQRLFPPVRSMPASVCQLLFTVLLYWRRKSQPTPVFLPGESHGWRSLVGYSPWGRKESDTTEQIHTHSLYF